MTVPTVSFPRRPALPAICVYSPGNKKRNSCPSCFRKDSKHTHRAGAFTPIANVSVENKTFTLPRQKSISTISFTIGSKPAWCTPKPRESSSRTRVTCGNVLSAADNRDNAFSQKMCVSCFSFWFSTSRLCLDSAFARPYCHGLAPILRFTGVFGFRL